jgi:hypothetical protein
VPLISRSPRPAPVPSPYEAAGASTNMAPAPRVARSARAGGFYDRAITIAALVGGLALCAAAWLVGARFTITAIESTGWLVSAGALIWAIPVLVTALELRFSPNRRRGTASRLFWGLVLGFDVLTTGWGAMPWVAQWSPDLLTSAILAALLGMVFALGPEPAARALLRENL